MFKIVANPTFTATVRLSIPGSDVPGAVQITFRHKGTRALHAWLASAAKRETDTEFLGEIIENWQGVADVDGQPLAYTPDALAQLLDAYPAAGKEIIQAYNRQLADARAGN